MKKVLIPTLRFPPAGGVGLRRIIKIGKKLAEKGVEVHYITTNNSAQINSYVKDIGNSNIHITRIPSLSLNNYFSQHTKHLVGKIIAKLVYYITMPLFFIDYATLWGIVLIPYALWYMKKHKIKNIYVSGAPFSTVFHMALMKKFFCREIHLISEWRDFWTGDYARAYLPPKFLSKSFQVWMEKFSVVNSDVVVSVTETLLESLQVGESLTKYKLIENGFDKDDFCFQNSGHDNKNTKDGYVVCYTGNIVDTRSEGLCLFLDMLKTKKITNTRLEICGELGFFVKRKIHNEYQDLLNDNILIYHGLVSVHDALELVERSDYCLVLVQRQHPEALTSKFFEYCYARKPIIAIGPEGDLQYKMNRVNVGIYCALDHFDENLLCEFIRRHNVEDLCFDNVIKYNDFDYLAGMLAKELCV